ncbi:MAG: hypothetical protein CFH40_01497 [Alphaproteobacteria bacterium MarineAlpha10_Bin3]|nr:MAG: hypothetical protein CFH40_01497 [Alphaproteobacteria bacterium MarineAlpha10_Bin3]PPR70561.1 MAG: hypothetical protein CFH09_01497 [Alphaproteobacteria bacterium MarineAlpha4_Bin1]
MKLPQPADASLEYGGARFDIDRDNLFDGVMGRRIVAYLIDLSIIGVISAAVWGLMLVTLFLASPVLGPIFPLIPIAYHTLLIGGRRSATIGMQFMGIEVRTLSGQRPELLQAFAMSALFYLSIAVTGMIVLLVALFNDRRHCAHDYLSGTVVINTDPEG